MNLADVQRRLENVIRIGTIAHVDVSNANAPRVRVADGALLTDWLPFGSLRAGTARVWSVPTVGEQVILLSPSGELASAVVFGSLFCAAVQAPSTSVHDHIIDLPDGTRISHNDQTGAMVFSGMKTVLIQASESVTIDTPQVTTTQKLTAAGLLTYQAGMSGASGSGASTSITGNFSQNGGELSSNGVVLDTHTHGGVMFGSSKTAAPAK